MLDKNTRNLRLGLDTHYTASELVLSKYTYSYAHNKPPFASLLDSP